MTHLHGSFSGVGELPRVAAAIGLSLSKVRVTFNEPMLENADYVTPANYVITHAMGSAARTVVTVQDISDTEVLLILDGDMTLGTLNYTVTVGAVVDAASNLIDGAHNSADFNAPGNLTTLPEYNSDGGEIVSFNLGLADADYFVDVGVNPNVSAVRAYSGVPGQGNHCSSLGGILTFAVPRLIPAEDYLVKTTPVLGGGSVVSAALFDARRRPIFEATHLLRRVCPGRWEIGPSSSEFEVVP